jgi:hypothetical protein
VAERLKSHLRAADVLARYGGEEFMVVLAGAPTDYAAMVADRLRAAHGVGGFEQDRAAAIGLHQSPGDVPGFRRQAFEHEGDVGGMQQRQALLEGSLVLAFHELRDDVVLGGLTGAADKLALDGLAGEQVDDLRARLFQVPLVRSRDGRAAHGRG